MRNCLILGCGRSGTSLLAGSLANAGYHMGDKLYRAREANPKGFYESRRINAINESLLKPLAPSRSAHWSLRMWRGLYPSERWLAEVPPGTPLPAPSPSQEKRIRRHLNRRPFAFKDPRFCYTLPVWRPYLPRDTVFLCIFREPGRTAASILSECVALYPDLHLTEKDVYAVWLAMYGHVLHYHRRQGSWLFVHYEQMLDGSAHQRIEDHLDTPIDHQFVDRQLARSASRTVPTHTLETYRILCTLARYST